MHRTSLTLAHRAAAGTYGACTSRRAAPCVPQHPAEPRG